MSDFKFSCPACGQHIQCDATHAGMSIACPACQSVVTVPAYSPANPTAGAQEISGLAIASFVCSIFLCVGCIPGIICGHLARRRIQRDPGVSGGGFAVAGLIISYLSLVGCFGVALLVYFCVSSPVFMKGFHKGFDEARERRAALHANETPAPENSNTNDAKPAISPLWNLNLTTAEFPDQPAAGKIHGQDFTVESARAVIGNITLKQGGNVADRQIMIFIPLKPGETLAGKTFDISPANSDLAVGPAPRVQMNWKESGGNVHRTTIFSTGYAMKLELGAADLDGKIPTKIYLCLPDAEKSCVAGTFELEVRKAPGKKKKKPPAN